MGGAPRWGQGWGWGGGGAGAGLAQNTLSRVRTNPSHELLPPPPYHARTRVCARTGVSNRYAADIREAQTFIHHSTWLCLTWRARGRGGGPLVSCRRSASRPVSPTLRASTLQSVPSPSKCTHLLHPLAHQPGACSPTPSPRPLLPSAPPVVIGSAFIVGLATQLATPYHCAFLINEVSTPFVRVLGLASLCRVPRPNGGIGARGAAACRGPPRREANAASPFSQLWLTCPAPMLRPV